MSYLTAAKAQADALAERYRAMKVEKDRKILFPLLLEAQGLYEAAAKANRAGVTDEEIQALADLIPPEKPASPKPVAKKPTKTTPKKK
jgi:hypothetical protein